MNYADLLEAVSGGSVAVRSRLRLQPADGPGGKVFPPTYGVRRGLKYATEQRVIDGERVQCVLLDSVASQANWMELALLDAWDQDLIPLSVASVDFSDIEGLEDLDAITSLEAPHRIADAIFRDSLLDGTLFRLSDIGRAITEATPANASAMFTYHATGLLFGIWDSTGPKGGLGSKFQRSITSEVVGIDIEAGVKVGSRIDPLSIEKNVEVYKAADPDEEWTGDTNAAATNKKGDPELFDRKGASGDPGAPSKINHGNVTPSIDTDAGGVTMDHALQTTVLSLAALRKLRFVNDSDGGPITKSDRRDVEDAARAAIAALGLAAIGYQHEMGLDLRSRCLLVPEARPEVELVGRYGDVTSLTLDVDAVPALLDEAVSKSAEAGLRWRTEELQLEPAPKLVELVRGSRRISAEQETE